MRTSGVSSGNYDITADGQRFLMVKDNDQDVFSAKLIVVLNWAHGLAELATNEKQLAMKCEKCSH